MSFFIYLLLSDNLLKICVCCCLIFLVCWFSWFWEYESSCVSSFRFIWWCGFKDDFLLRVNSVWCERCVLIKCNVFCGFNEWILNFVDLMNWINLWLYNFIRNVNLFFEKDCWWWIIKVILLIFCFK